MGTYSRFLTLVVLLAVLSVVAISSGKHLRRTGTRGDLETYVHGARLVLSGADLYRTPEPRGRVSYMYLPLFALLAIPLTAVPFEAAVVCWSILNVLFVAWIVAGFYRAMTGSSFLSLPSRDRWVVSGAGVLLSLRALLQHLDLGQANLLVMSVAVLGFVWFSRGREFLAGVALGLSVVLKIIALPLLIVLPARGSRRAAAGIGCGALVGLLLPALFVGFERNIAYVWYWLTQVVLPVNDLRSTAYWPLEWNYSLAAQFYRFFGGVLAFHHEGQAYSVTVTVLPAWMLRLAVRLIPPLTALVILGYVWRYRRGAQLFALWGAVALAFCLAPIFSTVSLKHHYVMLLPAHVYVVYLWYVTGVRDWWFTALVAGSFAVAMLSTTLFHFVGALMSNLGGLVWGAMLLAAAIFRAANVSRSDEAAGP